MQIPDSVCWGHLLTLPASTLSTPHPPCPVHIQQPEGSCSHLSQILSLLAQNPTVAPASLCIKAWSSQRLRPSMPAPCPHLPPPLTAMQTWQPPAVPSTACALLPQGLCTCCAFYFECLFLPFPFAKSLWRLCCYNLLCKNCPNSTSHQDK